MSQHTMQQQIDSVAREIKMRESVYPRWVAAKKMSQDKATHEIAAMKSVLATLIGLQAVGGKPQPVTVETIPPDLVLGGELVESTRINAEYWLNGARREPDRSRAIMFVEQSVNAWKNAAYGLAHDAARYRLFREIGFEESFDAYDADGLDKQLDDELCARRVTA